MTHCTHVAILVGLALLAPHAALAQAPSGSKSGGQIGTNSARCEDAVCEQIVVKLEPNQSIEAINAAFGTATLRTIPQVDTFLLQIPQTAAAAAMQTWLMNDPRVAWAEMNYVAVAPAGGTQSFFLSATFHQYLHQESLVLIQADQAHRWASAQGTGQIVAVLDTGIDPSHRLVKDRLAPGGFNYIGNTPDYRDVGNGFDDNGNGLIDELTGHGTMVSGLILRVAPQARIIPMRVLNCDGVGSTFYIAQAIYDAIDHGATVINISLGSIRPTETVAMAVQAAESHGIVVIAAAGNTDRSEPRFYPAAFESVIAVAGTDINDRKAEFSDYGSWIDLAAPSVDLVSAFPGGTYARSSGTSLAAPLVAGTAALLRSQNPGMTPAQVTARIRATAASIDPLNPEYAGLLGSGRLDIGRAVALPTSSRR
jgi:subtilisin family serine protease